MGITKFPNGISSMGMPLVGGHFTTGSVFFVDSVTGSNGNSGTDKDHPLATIDNAIGKCTANKGDIIFAMPNHAETLTTAAAIVFDIIGVSLIGLGNGTDRPTITLGTSTGCDIDIDVANILIENIYFDMTGVDAVAAGIDVNASNFTLRNCEILMSDTAGQATCAIEMAAAADDCVIVGNKILAPEADANCAIHLDTTVNATEIAHNWIDGDFAQANIWASAAVTYLNIHDNVCRNVNAAEGCIELGTSAVATTGMIFNNVYAVEDDTALVLHRTNIGKTNSFNNYVNVNEVKSGMLTPAVDTSSDIRLKTQIVYL